LSIQNPATKKEIQDLKPYVFTTWTGDGMSTAENKIYGTTHGTIYDVNVSSSAESFVDLEI